ncbi:hypothetical protein XELAEV_18034702mg [Xenopus laevis]|uniref:Uncharacterized protein n=1 Tax=Xenopus laevis TaxID=8355 RepID=A0A974CEF2_XENLA|nr:hypothetical protein XELAEV_18034702mg [Xenopus laevis]
MGLCAMIAFDLGGFIKCLCFTLLTTFLSSLCASGKGGLQSPSLALLCMHRFYSYLRWAQCTTSNQQHWNLCCTASCFVTLLSFLYSVESL